MVTAMRLEVTLIMCRQDGRTEKWRDMYLGKFCLTPEGFCKEQRSENFPRLIYRSKPQPENIQRRAT